MRSKPYPERKAAKFRRHFYNKTYLKAIQEMPCLVCRRSPCHAHHHPTKGAGGTWRDLTPLCPVCHGEFHSQGQRTFQEKHGLDLREEARAVYNNLSQLRQT